MTYLFIAVIAIALIALIAKSSGSSAPTKRTDIQYGYFGGYWPTAEEVANHVSLFWVVPHWEGIDMAIKSMRLANKDTVLDCASALFTPPPAGEKGYTPNPNAEYDLRLLLSALRSANVLHMVKVLTPIDEPNLPETNVDRFIPDAMSLLRRVASEYEELKGVKYGVIYYSRTPMLNMELFDILGFDDYDAGVNILAPDGAYEQFRAKLRPDQRTWLITGGTYGQSPQPFIQYANKNKEVWAIIPFIWTVPPWETSFKGIRDLPEMRTAHISAGLELKGDT